MIRTVLYLLVAIFLVTFLRYVIGMIGRAFSELLHPKSSSSQAAARQQQTGGELKKDPVCGTFVPAATSVKKTVRGEVVHFCSGQCRDRYNPN